MMDLETFKTYLTSEHIFYVITILVILTISFIIFKKIRKKMKKEIYFKSEDKTEQISDEFIEGFPLLDNDKYENNEQIIKESSYKSLLQEITMDINLRTSILYRKIQAIDIRIKELKQLNVDQVEEFKKLKSFRTKYIHWTGKDEKDFQFPFRFDERKNLSSDKRP